VIMLVLDTRTHDFEGAGLVYMSFCTLDTIFIFYSERFSITFRAFDTTRQGFLSWFETLIGIACLEPSTPHGGSPAEFRCRFIFRFYDKDSDGLLNWSEFR